MVSKSILSKMLPYLLYIKSACQFIMGIIPFINLNNSGRFGPRLIDRFEVVRKPQIWLGWVKWDSINILIQQAQIFRCILSYSHTLLNYWCVYMLIFVRSSLNWNPRPARFEWREAPALVKGGPYVHRKNLGYSAYPWGCRAATVAAHRPGEHDRTSSKTFSMTIRNSLYLTTEK